MAQAGAFDSAAGPEEGEDSGGEDRGGRAGKDRERTEPLRPRRGFALATDVLSFVLAIGWGATQSAERRCGGICDAAARPSRSVRRNLFHPRERVPLPAPATRFSARAAHATIRDLRRQTDASPPHGKSHTDATRRHGSDWAHLPFTRATDRSRFARRPDMDRKHSSAKRGPAPHEAQRVGSDLPAPGAPDSGRVPQGNLRRIPSCP